MLSALREHEGDGVESATGASGPERRDWVVASMLARSSAMEGPDARRRFRGNAWAAPPLAARPPDDWAAAPVADGAEDAEATF
eukprot:12035723-Alexandrium_andersonii.AAC.1